MLEYLKTRVKKLRSHRRLYSCISAIYVFVAWSDWYTVSYLLLALFHALLVWDD